MDISKILMETILCWTACANDSSLLFSVFSWFVLIVISLKISNTFYTIDTMLVKAAYEPCQYEPSFVYEYRLYEVQYRLDENLKAI